MGSGVWEFGFGYEAPVDVWERDRGRNRRLVDLERRELFPDVVGRDRSVLDHWLSPLLWVLLWPPFLPPWKEVK